MLLSRRIRLLATRRPPRSIAALLPLVLCAAAMAQGRIVVAHDEWTLSNTGFGAAASTTRFVHNVAAWFNDGLPGNFRAWSGNFGVTQTALAAAMTSAGHGWTVSTSGTFDLATLQQYDGVFVVGDPINAAVLTQYVQAGGNVYVAAGTGGPDPAQLNPFLNQFGLQLSGLNGFSESYAIANAHPIFAAVTELFHNNGNSVSLTSGAGASTQILVTKNGLGLYAVYEGGSTYASNTTVGTGCHGLVLGASSRPLLGTNWDLDLSSLPAGSLIAALSLGFSNPGTDLTSIGAPGCTRYTSALANVLLLLPIGTPAYAVSLPASPGYIGLPLFAQGAVYAPGVNALDVAFSNGVRGRVGDI